MWKYVQENGQIFQNGKYIDTGYSGSGAGKNDPAKECERNVGPIPRGWYTIGQEISKPTPVTLPLSADDPNYCNPPRDGFLIHGDNTSGTASTGCIVSKRTTRVTIRDSGDNRLQVVKSSTLSIVASTKRKKKISAVGQKRRTRSRTTKGRQIR
jgi:hypothetical protein